MPSDQIEGPGHGSVGDEEALTTSTRNWLRTPTTRVKTTIETVGPRGCRVPTRISRHDIDDVEIPSNTNGEGRYMECLDPQEPHAGGIEPSRRVVDEGRDSRADMGVPSGVVS